VGRLRIESLAGLVAVAFIVVGIAGFIPGLTQHFAELGWWDGGSGAELFGVFRTSILHNLVHLGFGVAGLVLARTATGAWIFLVGGGIAYLNLAIYGFAVDLDVQANFLPADQADNVLHLVLGAGMVVLGLLAGRQRRPLSA
jgi:hypothetical protein